MTQKKIGRLHAQWFNRLKHQGRHKCSVCGIEFKIGEVVCSRPLQRRKHSGSTRYYHKACFDKLYIAVDDLTPEEVSRITQLVREAIGFNAQRGDSVRVVNAAFQIPPAPEELPEIPIWEQAWVWDLAKQIGGFILVLVLIFVVLLPTMKKLTTQQSVAAGGYAMAGAGAAAGGGAMVGMEGGMEEMGMESFEGGRKPVKLPGPGKYEDTLDAARQLVNEDPMRVAQVVKSWVSEDGR